MERRIGKQLFPLPTMCDVFDWTCAIECGHLHVCLRTDLPEKTQLHLLITRPSDQYIWTGFDELISIETIDDLRGFALVRSVEKLDRDGLNKYRHWKGRFPSLIEGLPQDQLVIRIVLNALDHQFGTCNRDLHGSQIQVRKNGHWIERHAELEAAIPDWLPDALP